MSERRLQGVREARASRRQGRRWVPAGLWVLVVVLGGGAAADPAPFSGSPAL